MFKNSPKLAAVSLLVLLAACSPEYCEDSSMRPTPTVAAATTPIATPTPAPAAAPVPAPEAAPVATTPSAVPVAPAPIQAETASDKPLVVIRFNQNKKINYKQLLKETAGKVEAMKPGAHYDIVSYVPTTGNPAIDQRQAMQALRNQQGMTNEMLALGIPADRITVRSRYTPAAQMGEQEAQIFLR